MELFNRFFIILLVTGVILADVQNIPDTFTKCKRSDPDFTKCLAMAVTGAIQYMKSGLPEFGILSLDPLSVDFLSMSHGDEATGKILQEFRDVKMYNLSQSIIKEYIDDLDNYRLKSIVMSPRIEIIANYQISGNMLMMMPIVGKGKSNITIIDLYAEHELIGESYTKNNEIYWHITDYKIKLEPNRMHMNFENLFNGDKMLGEFMNNFMNENWELVFNENKHSYEESFGLIFKQMCNKIFSKVPMNKIFLD